MLSLVVFTRLATPKEYGVYSLLLVVVGLANIGLFQWIRSSVLKFYNEYSLKRKLMNTMVTTQTTILFMIVPLLVIVTFFLRDRDLEFKYLIIFFIMLVLVSFYELLVIVYRARLNPTKVVVNNILKSIILFLITATLLYSGLGVFSFIIGFIISTLIALISFSRNLNFNKVKLELDAKVLKTSLSYGLPITLSFLLSVALQNIDKIMISMILGVEENGAYSVSFDLIHNSLYMVMTALALAGLPIVLKVTQKQGVVRGKEEYRKYGELFYLISIPSTLGLVAVSPYLINLIIDEQYIISDHLITLIIFATLFHGIKSHYFDFSLQVSGKTKYYFYPAMLAIIINIILNYFLLKRFGIEGAAFATLIAFFFAMILSGFYSRRSYSIKFAWSTFFKILLTSFVMYFSIVFLPEIGTNFITLILKIIIGLIIYIGFIYLLDVSNIRSLLREWRK